MDSSPITIFWFRRDKRVAFIHQMLSQLSQNFKKRGSTIYVAHGDPVRVFGQLIEQYQVAELITNHDFEPYAIERDKIVGELLAGHGIRFQTFKDQVIFDPPEMVKPDGTPYVGYTPYAKAWKKLLGNLAPAAYPGEMYLSNLLPHEPLPVPPLTE